VPEAARQIARFKDNEREFMKAVRRWTIVIVAAGFALGASPTAAQQSEEPAPATDAIGPRDLQNFNLQGTVTRQADTPAPAARAAPAAPRAATTSEPREIRSAARQAVATPERREPPAQRRSTETEIASAAPVRSAAPRSDQSGSAITVPLPPISTSLSGGTEAQAEPSFTEESETAAASLAPEHRMALWPWLLAAMALGAGGAFLFWRHQHSREAFAGGPQVDAFVAPEAPAQRPRQAPPAAAPRPASSPSPGLVSTKLRPWLDIAFQPIRCIVEDQRVIFEFQLELQNSGSGPARDVLIEACMINASPTQEQEIENFFEHPAGQGERIATIPPLKSMELRPRVVVPREQLRVLDAGGRKVFVPLLAFNALYRWGNGEGQTSGAYLLGRENKGEKLAPFRLDLGARLFRGVEARPLPLSRRN
jgi:hypothetical protein